MGAQLYILLVSLFIITGSSFAATDDVVEENIGSHSDGSRTDTEAVAREEEAIQLDGLNVADMKNLRDAAEKHQFQAEVDRMMKLIINSLYKNKEIFLRELISNASDALDKLRFIAVTNKSALDATEDLSIRIKADKENNLLHIIDTGIGMTKSDLVNNLGTIAKSGTSDFLKKISEGDAVDSDLIGQFGVGFYSSFLVADRVFVASKNNDDKQYLWESDSMQFSLAEDPRGDTLLRGTQISLHMRPESAEFLKEDKLQELVSKYSQFINFPIYLWSSKVVTEEVKPEVSADSESAESAEKEKADGEEEDSVVEEEEDKKKEEPKTVEKTVWDWKRMNEAKPIWLRKPSEVTDEEYKEFYKSFERSQEDPIAYTHFTAEGEVTFKSILFVPKTVPSDTFTDTPNMDYIKLYVKRVFIADKIDELMPKYLSFVKGIVDSDDLPLNVSRETLQQNKLIKLIRKKLIRKVLDMFKKMGEEEYNEFFKSYGVKLKFGVMEDASNKNRIAKLLRFQSSNHATDLTSLDQYIERMKTTQGNIYVMGGISREEIEKSPFVEKLLKKGYEVIYMVDPIDEYCVQSLTDYESKKFQNAAKEGLTIGKDSEKRKELKEQTEEQFKPLLGWLKEAGLKNKIERATISDRLDQSPCALVASQWGYSGNMERIMKAQGYHRDGDNGMGMMSFNQKKVMEINPRHPLIKELLRQVQSDPEDTKSKDLAETLYDTALLRSGYHIPDTVEFAGRIERMLKSNFDLDVNAEVEPDLELADEGENEEADDAEEVVDSEKAEGEEEEAEPKDEL